MRVIFPLNGKGERFSTHGYTDPKCLLLIGTKPLFSLVLTTYTPWTNRHYLLRGEWLKHPTLFDVLGVGCCHFLPLDTAGPLQTCLTADQCVRTDDSILIADCDSFLDAQELQEAIAVFRFRKAQGGVTVRRTNDPGCSYVSVDSEWWVTQAREKDPFSTWSSTGPYWFASGHTFLEAATKASAAGHVSISPVYNYLVGKTAAVPVSSFHHLGTPEALETFRATIAQWENHK